MMNNFVWTSYKSHCSRNDYNNNCIKLYYSKARFPSIFLFSVGLTSLLGLFFIYSPHLYWVSSKRGFLHSHASFDRRFDDNSCDLFKGHWVPDLNGSAYTSTSCVTIPESKNCFKYGRKDTDFVNWRWKPEGCELPRFNPVLFLKIVSGKKLAFIGDSVARNQMESLLCLLSQAKTPVDVYKDSEDRFRTWYFPSSNFTLMIFWSKFLVMHEEQVINGSNSGVYNLYLDKVNDKWASKLQGVDYAIISDAHWFFRKNYLYNEGKLMGCVYCNEPNVTQLGLNYALRMAFRAALKYINDECKSCIGMLTFIRTYSPAHFENGTWNDGGTCNRTSPNNESQDDLRSSELDLRDMQIEELERATKEGGDKGRRFRALDITKAMLMRPDGHPGANWDNQWMKGYNDCVHWCMPGPIDAWNELLLAVLQREVGLWS